MALGQPETLDPTLKPRTGANNESVRRIIVQPDRKVPVVGSFTQFNGQILKYLVRLKANGRLDETIYMGLGFNAEIGDTTLHMDGKIMGVAVFRPSTEKSPNTSLGSMLMGRAMVCSALGFD
jgi:hypothetical protein